MQPQHVALYIWFTNANKPPLAPGELPRAKKRMAFAIRCRQLIHGSRVSDQVESIRHSGIARTVSRGPCIMALDWPTTGEYFWAPKKCAKARFATLGKSPNSFSRLPCAGSLSSRTRSLFHVS